MIYVVISEYNVVKLEINTEKIKIENLKYLHLYIGIAGCS